MTLLTEVVTDVLPVQVQKHLATVATQDLPTTAKKDVVTKATQTLPPQEQKEVATAATLSLSSEDKKVVATKTVQPFLPKTASRWDQSKSACNGPNMADSRGDIRCCTSDLCHCAALRGYLASSRWLIRLLSY
jgi:hypothetical protein